MASHLGMKCHTANTGSMTSTLKLPSVFTLTNTQSSSSFCWQNVSPIQLSFALPFFLMELNISSNLKRDKSDALQLSPTWSSHSFQTLPVTNRPSLSLCLCRYLSSLALFLSLLLFSSYVTHIFLPSQPLVLWEYHADMKR